MRLNRPRLTLLLAATLFAASLTAAPSWAGSLEDPEITDAAGDHKVLSQGPDPQNTFLSADILAAWVAEETDTTFVLQLQAAQMIRGGSSNGQTTTQYTYSISGKVGEAPFLAAAQVVNNPPEVTPIADAVEASAADDILTLVVSKTTFEGIAPGTVMSELYAASNVQMRGAGPNLATDRAPDSGFGRDYVFSPGTAVADILDSDADGLNDTWEEEQFGNLTYNATDDPDLDGCDNACEYAAGTNALEADTDGDGVSDGDEIAAGTNPLDPSDGALDGNATASPEGNQTADVPPASGDNGTAAVDDTDAGVDTTASLGGDKESPGFGAIAALAALGTTLLVRTRRR